MIICTARCARNTLLIDRQTAEAIGAKNGCGWPSTSLAMYQARPDAMAVCTVGNHTPRSRSMARAAAVGHLGKQQSAHDVCLPQRASARQFQTG